MAVTVSTDLNLNGNLIHGLASPVVATDAVNKSYVDTISEGLDWKEAARVATTANVTLSGAQTIDGVNVVAGDRVLVKNQSTGNQNGIYVAATGAWARSDDASTGTELKGAVINVLEGTANAGTAWRVSNTGTITIGSTSITWSQVPFGMTQLPGEGLLQNGNAIDVGAGTGISVTANAVAIDTAVVARKVAGTITGDGSTTVWNITHNLGTRDVIVEVYRNATPWDTILCDVERPDTNTARITITPADSVVYRVVVHG